MEIEFVETHVTNTEVGYKIADRVSGQTFGFIVPDDDKWTVKFAEGPPSMRNHEETFTTVDEATTAARNFLETVFSGS